MAERNGVISLQAFLHKYFAKNGVDEDEMHRYRFIAADGLKELSIHHLPLYKSAVLTIETTNNTADYPDDYSHYVAIAVESQGRWWSFTRATNMVDKSVAGVSGEDLSNYNFIGGPGGVGGENGFYFQDDPKNRRFLFDETYSGTVVVLRYASIGVDVVAYASDDDIEFPVTAERAMEDYLRWQVAEYDGAPVSELLRRKKMYDDSVLMLRGLSMPTVDEIRDLWLGSSNQTFIRLP